MYLSVVIPIVAKNTPKENDFLGRACHAFFLRSVAGADHGLADSLHKTEPHSPKCFTVSSVLAQTQTRPHQSAIVKNEQYWIRFTSLNATLTECLLLNVLPNLPSSIVLGKAEFEVKQPIIDRKKHEWAGYEPAENIVNRWLGAETLPSFLTLQFLSPTCARRIRREWVLPTPSVVFSSLLKSWNHFGNKVFDGDITKLIEADVFVQSYSLHTKRIRIGEGLTRGWLGKVTYRIFAKERGLRVILHTLADFAQYSSVGYKTTQGLGQTKVLRYPETKP